MYRYIGEVYVGQPKGMWPDGSSDFGQGRSSTGSEVVLDDKVFGSLDTSNDTTTVNVTKSSRVHIGPKFLNITQNVHNTEVIKGGCLGLELVSPKHAGHMRCSVAVFVCWALVVASGLAFYLFSIALPTQPIRLDIGLKENWYLRRGDWQAMPPYRVEFRNIPLRYVLVCHSATNFCSEKYECITQVRNMQQDHLQRGFEDIGSNYVIGGNGIVFEGRGANVVGAMVLSWNRISVSVTFLGNYDKDTPDEAQVTHFKQLLHVLVEEGVLQEDYVIYGHCQVATHIISPGNNIIAMLQQFTNWNPVNSNLSLCQYLGAALRNTTRAERLCCGVAILLVVVCTALIVYYTAVRNLPTIDNDVAPHEWNITRTMWLAQPYNNTLLPSEYNPLRLVIVQHSVSQECFQFAACAAEMRNLQSYFINYKNYDIPYNFVIGNDGRVYQARGWGFEGAHTRGFNRCALGIGFIGDYREEKGVHSRVSESQLNRTLLLLAEGVRAGFLHPRYLLVGAKDLQPTSESPGSNLYDAIRQWEHYDRSHRFRNMTCHEINLAPMPASVANERLNQSARKQTNGHNLMQYS